MDGRESRAGEEIHGHPEPVGDGRAARLGHQIGPKASDVGKVHADGGFQPKEGKQAEQFVRDKGASRTGEDGGNSCADGERHRRQGQGVLRSTNMDYHLLFLSGQKKRLPPSFSV